MWDVSAGSIAALTVLGITAVALSDIIGTAIAAHDRVARTRKAGKGDTEQMPDLPSRQLRHHARRVWRRTRMARGWAKVSRRSSASSHASIRHRSLQDPEE